MNRGTQDKLDNYFQHLQDLKSLSLEDFIKSGIDLSDLWESNDYDSCLIEFNPFVAAAVPITNKVAEECDKRTEKEIFEVRGDPDRCFIEHYESMRCEYASNQSYATDLFASARDDGIPNTYSLSSEKKELLCVGHNNHVHDESRATDDYPLPQTRIRYGIPRHERITLYVKFERQDEDSEVSGYADLTGFSDRSDDGVADLQINMTHSSLLSPDNVFIYIPRGCGLSTLWKRFQYTIGQSQLLRLQREDGYVENAHHNSIIFTRTLVPHWAYGFALIPSFRIWYSRLSRSGIKYEDPEAMYNQMTSMLKATNLIPVYSDFYAGLVFDVKSWYLKGTDSDSEIYF